MLGPSVLAGARLRACAHTPSRSIWSPGMFYALSSAVAAGVGTPASILYRPVGDSLYCIIPVNGLSGNATQQHPFDDCIVSASRVGLFLSPKHSFYHVGPPCQQNSPVMSNLSREQGRRLGAVTRDLRIEGGVVEFRSYCQLACSIGLEGQDQEILRGRRRAKDSDVTSTRYAVPDSLFQICRQVHRILKRRMEQRDMIAPGGQCRLREMSGTGHRQLMD
jgi:hypothetical protein